MSTPDNTGRVELVRKTITIPRELMSHVEERAAGPLHCKNVSSYLRSLIVADYEKVKSEEKETSLPA